MSFFHNRLVAPLLSLALIVFLSGRVEALSNMTPHGLHIANAHYETGEAGTFLIRFVLPVPKELAPYLREGGGAAVVVRDVVSNIPILAETEATGYWHLPDGPAPRFLTVRAPLSTTGESRRIEIYVESESLAPGAGPFRLNQATDEFLNSRVVADFPGAAAGWTGHHRISDCLNEYQGIYTRRLSCNIKAQPASGYAHQIESALAVSLSLEITSAALPLRNLVSVNATLHNSSVLGAYHVPVYSASLKFEDPNGSDYSLFAHNITLPGRTTPHYRQVVQNNSYYIIPPAAQGTTHTIFRDHETLTGGLTVSLDAASLQAAERQAAATLHGIVSSERAPDSWKVVSNWSESGYPQSIAPILSEDQFSETEMRTRVLHVLQDGELQDGTHLSNPTCFGLDQVPGFYTTVSGYQALGQASDNCLDTFPKFLTLLVNYKGEGLRFLIEASIAQARAFSNRWALSLTRGPNGEAMSGQQLIDLANGRVMTTGSDFSLHPTAQFHPNNDRLRDPAVMMLESIAEAAPYFHSFVGTGARYFEPGVDDMHALRARSAFLTSTLFSVPDLLQRIETVTELQLAFRTDVSGRSNLGCFWDVHERDVNHMASLGRHGSSMTRRYTEIYYLVHGLMRKERITPLQWDRVRVLLNTLNTSMIGQQMLGNRRAFDVRDIPDSLHRRAELMRVVCLHDGNNQCEDPFYFMADLEARNQYCRQVPDPQNPSQTVTTCDWPEMRHPSTPGQRHRAAPSEAVKSFLSRNVIVKSWESNYVAGFFAELLSVIRDQQELQTEIQQAIQNLRSHLSAVNDSCDGIRSFTQCGKYPDGSAPWAPVLGTYSSDFPVEIQYEYTQVSNAARLYIDKSLIWATMEFVEDQNEAWQSFKQVYPEVHLENKEQAFDQYTNPSWAPFSTLFFKRVFE